MTSHSSDPADDLSPLFASQRSELLQVLVDIAAALVNKQLDGFTTRLAEALLLRAADFAAEPKEAQLRVDAANLLKKNRYPFYYAVSEHLAAALGREVDAIENPSAARAETGARKPLPPDLEVDKKLSLLKAGREIESEHAGRISTLNMRLACVLGRDKLATAHNPFRPQLLLSVIHEAWCDIQPDADAHHLVYQLLGPQLCVDMGPLWQALNAALVKRGILPDLALPAHSESAAAQPAADAEEASNDPVIRQLQRLFPAPKAAPDQHADCPLAGELPALFAEDTLHANVSRSQLLSYLAEIQKNGPGPYQAANARGGAQQESLLAHVKRQAPSGTLTQADASAIDLLITIFDAVFQDGNIPAEIKALIGSLQIPVLRATLTDKNFFFSEAHPARRAIELAARLGVGWDRKKGAADPLYQTILRNVKRIQSDQRVPSFSDAVEDIEAFLAREDADSAEALLTPIARALEQEKHLQATKEAKQEVALRIGTGEVVAFVETFLEDKWVPVLTLAYTVKDENPQALGSAVKTMDDLCWSVKPKITMEERKELLARLPGIVAMLNKWLDLIKWNDDARVKFFSDLAKCHASIVRAPLELSPERRVQLAITAARQAAERRQQRQQAHPDPAPDQFDKQVQKLERGAWVEFIRADGAVMKVKLAWTSPMHSMFIFATRERQEALTISGEGLARALRERRARVVLEAGLVGRALAQALADESANGDAIGGESAA